MIAWFISDLHAGIHNDPDEASRLEDFRTLLTRIRSEGGALFLLGDVFDFWYEKDGAPPPRHLPWLSALRELTESGTEAYWLPGNHDFLGGRALSEFLQLQPGAESLRVEMGQRQFLLHHGDGLDPQERGYLLLKRVLHNPLLQGLFRLLPLQVGMWFGDRISDTNSADCVTWSPEQLSTYLRRGLPGILASDDEFFIMGHAHRPCLMSHGDTQVAVLPPFLAQARGYGTYDGERLELRCLHPESCPQDWIPFIRKG